MRVLASAVLFLTFVAATAQAQVNAGEQKPEADLPFTMTQVATFNLPWRIAFLPDGRMLVTERPVAVTSRHQWKLDRAKELGADFGVVDTGQDWSKDIRAWTNKRGVDMAIDSSGKATHLNCIKSLARGGTYVTPGATSGPDAMTDLARVAWDVRRRRQIASGGRTRDFR